MEALGIDFKILLAQIINFSLLLFILSKYLYKPIIKVLEERKKKQEETVLKFEEAQRKLTEIDEERAKILKKAEEEGAQLIKKGRLAAQEEREKILNQARNQAKQIVEKGHLVVAKERKALEEEVKDEAVVIGIAVAEKILGEKIKTSEELKNKWQRLVNQLLS